jgi:hypothetical protein
METSPSSSSLVEPAVEEEIKIPSIPVERITHSLGIYTLAKVIIHGDRKTNFRLRELVYRRNFEAQFRELCGNRICPAGDQEVGTSAS